MCHSAARWPPAAQIQENITVWCQKCIFGTFWVLANQIPLGFNQLETSLVVFQLIKSNLRFHRYDLIRQDTASFLYARKSFRGCSRAPFLVVLVADIVRNSPPSYPKLQKYSRRVPSTRLGTLPRARFGTFYRGATPDRHLIPRAILEDSRDVPRGYSPDRQSHQYQHRLQRIEVERA